MFVDLNTDALHLKTDGRGWGRDTIGYPLPFFPERYLDNFLLLSGSVRRFRYLTGFFTQSPDMVVKCAVLWSSVFVTLVAKKYRFMQFELDMVFDTR